MRTLRGLCAITIVSMVGLCGSAAWAVNSVTVVPDTTVDLGATSVQIGIFIENDIDLNAIILPIEIRSGSGSSAFIAGSLTLLANPAGRVGNSGITDFEIKNTYPTPLDSCSGPTSRSYAAPASPDFASPDAVFYSGVRFTGACLTAGADDPSIPSFFLTFDVNSNLGSFEIDTCCITPANHLIFAGCGDPAPVITPSFSMGVVNVGESGIRAIGGAVPESFELGQNYPNPFNAGTIIPFSIEQFGHVRLDVYNILGRLVATLVNDDLEQSRFLVDWDGTNDNGQPLATGVYFYRVVTDSHTSTRKMLLLK